MKRYFIPFFLLLIFILPGCRQISIKKISLPPAKKQKIESLKPKECRYITVWIHGTRLLPAGMFVKHFYSKPGLHHYKQIESIYKQYKIAHTLISSDEKCFCADDFYLFGWSGKLSHQAREQAAIQLYNELKLLRTTYLEKYGIEPKIRIISHSHGGNVALLLAKIKDLTDIDFKIDELILLACPVQTQTMLYAHEPIFSKIYSLYSILDFIQIADPQGLRSDKKSPLFSQRFFPHANHIQQIGIKKNDRSLMHMEFIRDSFLSQLSDIIKKIDQWHTSSTMENKTWNLYQKFICLKTKPKNHLHCSISKRSLPSIAQSLLS